LDDGVYGIVYGLLIPADEVRMPKRIRSLLVAATLFAGALSAPAAHADPISDFALLCQAFCTSTAIGCYLKTQNADLCGGYFDGCWTGCGF
jgi:hypothetical protein